MRLSFKMSIFIFFMAFFIYTSYGATGVYSINANFPNNFYQCIKSLGHSQFTFYLHSYTNGASIDSLEYQNIAIARSNGIKVSAIFTPCRVNTPQQIAQDLASKFAIGSIDRFWLAPFNSTMTHFCDWKDGSNQPYSPPSYNCKFLNEIIQQMVKRNLRVGIVSNPLEWKIMFDTCNSFSNYLLYWFPSGLTPDSSLNGWNNFGGWTRPAIKTFTGPQLCGQNILYNNIF